MRLRPVTTALAGSVVTVGLAMSALTAGSPASAAPAPPPQICTFTSPRTVVVSAPNTNLNGSSLSSNCDEVAAEQHRTLSWRAYAGPNGNEPAFEVQVPVHPEDFTILGDPPLGTWRWSNGGNTGINTPSPTSVRLGSKAYLRVSRSGSTVQLWTRDSRYVPQLNRWYFYSGWHGQLQWRFVGYTTWHALKDTRQDATGSYSYTSTQPYAREYRVVFPANSVVWGSVSPTLRS